jgi:hypothetical protein
LYCFLAGGEDGSVRVWDLRSRQCVKVISSPGKAPVTAALLVEWPMHWSTASRQGTGAGPGRVGPKRMQPLAPLAKFAGQSVGRRRGTDGFNARACMVNVRVCIYLCRHLLSMGLFVTAST